MSFRHSIETWFEKLAGVIYRRAKLFITCVLALTSIFAYYAPQISLDTSNEGFFHSDDEILLRYNAFIDQFDRDEVIVLAVKSQRIFEFQTLNKLYDLQKRLENELPYLDEIVSLFNVTYVRGENDTLIVEDLLEKWPETDSTLDNLHSLVLNHPIYPNILISEQGNIAALIIRPLAYEYASTDEADFINHSEGQLQDDFNSSDVTKLTPEQNAEFIERVKAIAQDFNSPDLQVYMAGLPLMTHELLVSLNRDIPLFTVVAILFIIVLLWVLYRRVIAVVLPLLTVLLALVSTVGTMVLLDVSFTVFTQVLPSFLLAVGIGDSIHFQTLYFREYNQNHDKQNALKHALGHAGLPMLMTSLTTAGGLLSFSFAEIAPIGQLGMFGALGVMLAFFYTVLLLPALITVFETKPVIKSKISQTTMVSHTLQWIGDKAVDHSIKIIVMSGIILSVAIYGAMQLEFRHNPLNWFPDGYDLRVATSTIDAQLKGSMNVEIVFDSGDIDGVKTVEFLQTLNTYQDYLKDLQRGELYVGKALSVVDTIKQVNLALHDNNKAFYRIPDNNELISQEMLLFESSGGDDFERQLDSDYQQARLTLKLPWTHAGAYTSFLSQIKTEAENQFSGVAQVTVTGMITLFTHTADAAIHSMARSYVIAAFVISFMMILLLNSIRLGLIAMIPNLFPIVVAMGMMGLLKFPLDLSSILVGSIAIGLSVDDTIHFMHHFRRYYAQCNDPRLAVHQTLQTSGRAMLFTSVILTCAFLIFTLSNLNNLDSFGLVTAFAIFMALLADIILAPALMVITARHPKLCQCLK